jgi:hypothetical protein
VKLSLSLLLALLLAGCGYSEALGTLRSADRIVASKRGSGEKVIQSTTEIRQLVDWLNDPKRDWGRYVVTTPVSSMYLTFSRGGEDLASAGLAEGWVIVTFNAPKRVVISSDLSKEDYRQIRRVIWNEPQT